MTHIVSVMVERVAFCKAGHSTKRKSVYRQERFGLSGRRLPVPMKVEGKCGHPGRVCPPAPPFGGGQTGTGCGYTRDWGGEKIGIGAKKRMNIIRGGSKNREQDFHLLPIGIIKQSYIG